MKPNCPIHSTGTCPAEGGVTQEMNITRKMRLALLMISLDSHYVCAWQTIVRLTEAGYISYEDGRAHITKEGRALLRKPLNSAAKPGLKKANPTHLQATTPKLRKA